MKTYLSPEMELRLFAALSIVTASETTADPDEWETEIVDTGDAYDPSQTDQA